MRLHVTRVGGCLLAVLLAVAILTNGHRTQARAQGSAKPGYGPASVKIVLPKGGVAAGAPVDAVMTLDRPARAGEKVVWKITAIKGGRSDEKTQPLKPGQKKIRVRLTAPASSELPGFSVRATNPANDKYSMDQVPLIHARPPMLRAISNISFNVTVPVGQTASGNVDLGAASYGTTTVTLSSSDTSIATVPATVDVRDGSQTATFTITGVAAGGATITCTWPQGNSRGRVTVQ